MTKLKGARLQELTKTLDARQKLNNQELCAVKGGCSSCEDTRRLPKGV